MYFKFNFSMNNFRYRATLFHILLSALIIAVCCVIALLNWFPFPLFLLDGTWKALLILACVDLIIGPLLTFIVSGSQKSIRERTFDFSVIAIIQISALVFGLIQIHDQRIVGFVHLNNEFHLVSAKAGRVKSKENDLPAYQNRYYGMITYKDFKGLSESQAELVMYDMEKYRKLEANIIKRATANENIIPSETLKKYGKSAVYKVIYGKQRNGIMILSANMEVLDIVLAHNNSSFEG